MFLCIVLGILTGKFTKQVSGKSLTDGFEEEEYMT